MAHTHARTSESAGASLYLLRWFRSAAVLLFGALATAETTYAQTLRVDPRDLVRGEPRAFASLLDAARPPRLSPADMGDVLRALPAQGEITDPGFVAQRKVDAVRQLLAATGRDWYEIKVIDLPQAVIALHARVVLLISVPALAILNAAELHALAAHEVGHEYAWETFERARRAADQQGLKDVELLCDAIAIVTLRRLGMDPSRLMNGIEKISRFNRQRFGTSTREANYPTIAERREFAQRITRWSAPLSRPRQRKRG